MSDNAAVYLPVKCPGLRSIMGGTAADSAVNILVREVGNQYDVQIAGVTVTCKVMDEEVLPGHIQGFVNYALQENQRRPNARIVHLLERIREVRCVLGCVIEPGFDNEGQVATFLFDIAHRFDGLILVNDSVFDSDGEPLLGSALENSIG